MKHMLCYMIDRKELMNEAYDSLLYVAGAVLVSMASQKILNEPLGTPQSLKGVAKLSVTVTASTVAVKYAQSKKWLPVDPFKAT